MSRITINTINLDQNGRNYITSPSSNTIQVVANGANVLYLNQDRVEIKGNITGNQLMVPNGNVLVVGTTTIPVPYDIQVGKTIIVGGDLQANSYNAVTSIKVPSANNISIGGQTLFMRNTWEHINTINATAVTSIISPIMNGYRAIRVYGFNIQPSSDGVRPNLRVGTDGVIDSANNYSWFSTFVMTAAGYGGDASQTLDSRNNGIPFASSGWPLGAAVASSYNVHFGISNIVVNGGAAFECLITNWNNSNPFALSQFTQRSVYAEGFNDNGTLVTKEVTGVYHQANTNLNTLEVSFRTIPSATANITGKIIFEGLR